MRGKADRSQGGTCSTGDADQDGIRGLGVQALRAANIAVAFFPEDLVPQVEEMNRDFIRSSLQSDNDPVRNPRDRELVIEEHKLFNLLRGINWIECDTFRFPPGPTDGCFNVGAIRQINADIDGIQDALVETHRLT